MLSPVLSRRRISPWLPGLVLAISSLGTKAEDWPQWRHDAGRTAATSETLAAKLHLQWTLHLPPPRPAWAKYPRLRFDASYEPVVMGTTLFLPSMINDSVTAIDTRSGRVKWRFFTDGPIRFAPVAWESKVYVASDDGFLYCLDAAHGNLLWKFRGLPADRTDRRVLGNDRLISMWPARGGPVLHEGTLYFGAGVWPFEGVYVHALDPRTGEVRWSNTESGLVAKALLDHNTRREGGLSPQGYLAVIAGRLVVPSGRAMPGMLDPRTGKLGRYSTEWGGRENLQKGGWYVAGNERYLFLCGDVYDSRSMKRLQTDPADKKELGEYREPILTAEAVYFSRPINRQVGYRPVGAGYESIVAWDGTAPTIRKRWEVAQPFKVHIKAGPRLYAGKQNTVVALELPGAGGPPKSTWSTTITGTPARMLAADGRLFVVTEEGNLYAFGPTGGVPRRERPALKASAANNGYAIVLGAGTGKRARELALQSQLHVIVIENDIGKVFALRTALTKEGLYGTRIVVHLGDPLTYPFPPYLADLITSEETVDMDARALKRLYRTLRPYGGTIERADGVVVMRRDGPPKGAAAWTHADADAGRSLVSRDQRVKAPLNVLWFGGAVDMIYPEWDFTHSHGATPLVNGGRLFLQIFPRIHAIDVYTGRHLWERAFPDAGDRRNFDYVATEDSVYLRPGPKYLRLDAKSGTTVTAFTPPAEMERCRAIRVWKDRLFGVTGTSLVCLNRFTGAVAWRRAATMTVADVAIGAGSVFYAETRLPDRRGTVTVPHGLLLSLDAATGEPRWEKELNLAAPRKAQVLRLAYAESNDVLLTVYGTTSAYRGKDGTLLWAGKAIEGMDQPMLHPARLITQNGEMFDPLTGNRLPGRLWTGKPNTNWDGGGVRGCNRALAGEHLALIRDAHASYFDLTTQRQTFFRGVRAGCTNSLIPGDGLLNAPNFSHGCSCNYAVFGSLAFVHLPEVDE